MSASVHHQVNIGGDGSAGTSAAARLTKGWFNKPDVAVIEPSDIINQSLVPLTVTDPVLRGRHSHKAKFIQEVITEHAQRTAIIRWQIESPVGHQALKQLIGGAASVSEFMAEVR